jgi:site-specific recombinase XerD
VIFNDRRHPRDLGADDIRQFLTSLAVEDQVAASTQNQARAALLFLYEHVLGQPPGRLEGVTSARASRRLPVVLSPREVRLLLDRLDDPARLCVRLMYGEYRLVTD